ncbi:MAG: HepT-like ribonuclease domain-containing protein [Caldilineaceae bacterium]
MNNQARKRIHDAIQACLAIEQFSDGADFEGYMANAMMRSAIERQIEIIGEALNLALQADASLEESLPEAYKIIGMRNRIIHGYDSVDHMIVWDVVQTKIIILRLQLEQLS